MLLFPFQYNYVDFKFFPARDAGAEVKVFVREFSVLGPDAPVAVASSDGGATIASGAKEYLVSGLDIPQALKLLPGVIQDVLAVPGGDAGLVYYRLEAGRLGSKDLLTILLNTVGGDGQRNRLIVLLLF